MELKKILEHLEKHIDMRMEEFDRIAIESKKLRQQAEKKEEQLALIFDGLKDVHPIIYDRYPERKELFDALAESVQTEEDKGLR